MKLTRITHSFLLLAPTAGCATQPSGEKPNGKVRRWEFYGADRKIEKVGFASRNDGLLDSQAFYAADGTLQRMEMSTRRNRRFDRVEFYTSGLFARSEENGDGRIARVDIDREGDGTFVVRSQLQARTR